MLEQAKNSKALNVFNVALAWRRAYSRTSLVRVIRSGGHLRREEYDGHHDGAHGSADTAELHEDYQAGAVRLVLDDGKTVAAAARDLGLTVVAAQLG